MEQKKSLRPTICKNGTIEFRYDGSTKIEKKVYKLSKAKLNSFKLIGTASGFELLYCLFIAKKHAKNFHDRVYGYYPKMEPPHKLYKISVSFYEKLKCSKCQKELSQRTARITHDLGADVTLCKKCTKEKNLP